MERGDSATYQAESLNKNNVRPSRSLCTTKVQGSAQSAIGGSAAPYAPRQSRRSFAHQTPQTHAEQLVDARGHNSTVGATTMQWRAVSTLGPAVLKVDTAKMPPFMLRGILRERVKRFLKSQCNLLVDSVMWQTFNHQRASHGLLLRTCAIPRAIRLTAQKPASKPDREAYLSFRFPWLV